MNDDNMTYRQNMLLVFFVNDFNALYDSVNVINRSKNTNRASSDLSQTMQYKVLALCSNLIKINKKTKKQVAWIEETRSIELEPEEKQNLVDLIGSSQQSSHCEGVAENPNLMAVAIEFRMKPLLQSKQGNAADRNSSEGSESKAFK